MEALAAAIATALLSMGSGAAISAARKAGETRDAVLVLTTQVKGLDVMLQRHILDGQQLMGRVNELDRQVGRLDSRVSALENGVVDRRGMND